MGRQNVEDNGYENVIEKNVLDLIELNALETLRSREKQPLYNFNLCNLKLYNLIK